MKSKDIEFNPELDLLIDRVIEIPPHLVFKAWTTPELLTQWFTPAPWKTVEATVELYPGGAFKTLMRSPDGQELPNQGCFLEIVENEKLVWSTAMTKGFRPSEDSLMLTAVLTFEKHPKGTHYRAHALHKNAADRKAHAEMGFETGWSIALDQLVTVMKKQL